MRLFPFIVALSIVTAAQAALNCSYDPEAFLTSAQDIRWSCYEDEYSDARCYSLVYYGEDVLAVYPDVEYVDGVGVVDYFASDNGLININFKTKDLYEGYTYSFSVVCGEVGGSRVSIFTRNVSLVQRGLAAAPYRAIWAKENAGYLVGFGFVGIAVLVLVVAVRRR